jgi:CBS domain-containing protein
MGKIKLRDIIKADTKKLISVAPGASLQDAAREISEHRVGILMVIDGADEVIGILSERDVTRAFADRGAEAVGATVADYMTADVVMCEETEEPYTAIWLMHEYGIRHLPIAANGRPKAILSSRDVLKYLSDHGSPEEQASLWEKTPPAFGY